MGGPEPEAAPKLTTLWERTDTPEFYSDTRAQPPRRPPPQGHAPLYAITQATPKRPMHREGHRSLGPLVLE